MTRVYNTANGTIRKSSLKGKSVVNGSPGRDRIKLNLKQKSRTDIFAGRGNDVLDIKANGANRVGMRGYDGNDTYKFKGSHNKNVGVGLGNSTRNGQDKLTVQSGSKNNTFNINVGSRDGSKGELIDEAGNKNNRFNIWDNGQESDLKATFKGQNTQVNGRIAEGDQIIKDQGKNNTFNLNLGAGEDQLSFEGKGAKGTITSGKEGDATITIKDGAVSKEGLTINGDRGDVVRLQGDQWQKAEKQRQADYTTYQDSKGNIVNINNQVKVLGAKANNAGKEQTPGKQIISTEDAKKLLKSADGMIPYSGKEHEKNGWNKFPQRSKDQMGIAFDQNFDFKDGVKGKQDGKVSLDEKNLAAHQLKWDTTAQAAQHDDKKGAISSDAASKGQNFLGQLFWHQDGFDAKKGDLRGGLDFDGDVKSFSQKDLMGLASLDGDKSGVSQKDFDLAYERYRQKKLDDLLQKFGN